MRASLPVKSLRVLAFALLFGALGCAPTASVRPGNAASSSSGAGTSGSSATTGSTSGTSGAADGNDAAFVSQSVPAQVHAGATFTISVTMRNDGATSWSPASTHGDYLGSQDPQDNSTWGTNRGFLDDGSDIPPGASATFQITLTAPATPGTYPMQWQMLQDGVEWFGALTPVASVTVSAPSSSVPAPNHPMLYGYYFADGRYGDDTATVWPYTNTYVALPKGYDTSVDWHAPFAQSLQNAHAAGKSIYLAMDAQNTWDDTLSIAAPYWDSVQAVEVMGEAGLGISDTQAAVQLLASKIQAAGLSYRPLGVLYGLASSLDPNGADNGWMAPNVDFVGIETYLPAPGDSDPAANAAAMQSMIETAKSRIPASKKIVFATQSYDRNGTWTDLDTLTSLQLPQYLEAYQDPRVMGLLMFDWGRPGGAKDHVELRPIQQQIGAVIPAPALPYAGPSSAVDAGSGGGPAFSPVTPTFTWSASVADGWFPKLAADGSAVVFGQGDVYYLDLAVGTEQLIETGAVYTPAWIRPGVFTYQRDITDSTASRVEVSTSDLVPRATSDDPGEVAGNMFVAADGHWASYLAGNPHRIAYDDQVIGTNTGGALSIGDDGWVAFAATNDQLALDVFHQGQFVKQVPAVGTPLFDSAIGAGGYIIYGGHGPVHGIDPSGVDTDLTICPGRYEGVGKVLRVNGQVWVATSCWEFATNEGYILLRPWGSSQAVIVSLGSVSFDVSVTADSFVIASNDDHGRLTVVKVPLAAPLQPMQ